MDKAETLIKVSDNDLVYTISQNRFCHFILLLCELHPLCSFPRVLYSLIHSEICVIISVHSWFIVKFGGTHGFFLDLGFST